MVRTVGDETQALAIDEQRRDQGDIGQVRAAEKGIVQHHHVSGAPVEAPDDVAHGERHAAEVHGNMCGLRAQRTRGIEYRTREVEPVLDVGREGRAAQQRAHFVAHRGHAAGEDAECNRVHREAPERGTQPRKAMLS